MLVPVPVLLISISISISSREKLAGQAVGASLARCEVGTGADLWLGAI